MEPQTSQIKYLVTSLSSAFLFIRSKRNQEVIVQRKRETSEPSRSEFKLATPLSSHAIYFCFLSPCFLNCRMRTVISTSKSCWYFRFQCALAPSPPTQPPCRGCPLSFCGSESSTLCSSRPFHTRLMSPVPPRPVTEILQTDGKLRAGNEMA